MSEGTRGAGADDGREWVVSVTTNMTMSGDVNGQTEVVENPDGTTTYVIHVGKRPSGDK